MNMALRSYCLAALVAGTLSGKAAQTNLADSPPPIPAAVPPFPTARSPVNFFRELRAATPEERAKLLADRSPENRKAIMAKIREYESLPPDERELRLQATDLRYYLLPLMRTDPTNRASELSSIPAQSRQRVTERIGVWDRLPASARAELLANEATLRYFTENAGATAEERDKILAGMSLARRQKLEAAIRQWQALQPQRREKLLSQFNQFFELNESEKQQALRSLSAPERKQIERTLRSYQSLTYQQRAQCLKSFDKFAGLPLKEQQQFLKNAERWTLMTPQERQAWREVVETVALLPPTSEMPPPPPNAIGPRSRPVATNGN